MKSFLLVTLLAGWLAVAANAGNKRDIVVICGEGIGYWDPSSCNQGMMGYHTPKIDRIAWDGVESSVK